MTGHLEGNRLGRIQVITTQHIMTDWKKSFPSENFPMNDSNRNMKYCLNGTQNLYITSDLEKLKKQFKHMTKF